MTKKGKLILLVVGVFVLVVSAIIITVINKGRVSFRADVTGTISNSATLQYCLQGDPLATCDPGSGRYTYSVQSNVVSTQVNSSSNPINFNLTVANRLAGCRALNGTITITPVGSSTPIVSNGQITLDTSCNFSYTPSVTINSGQYNIIIDFASLLKKTLSNISLPTSTTVNAGSTVSGDFSGNDCIQIEDWGNLFAKWGLTPSSGGWDPNYDLKGDNSQIGMEDWGVMFAGWNQGSACGP